MINLYEKSYKDLEDDYESQQLNEFYNQEDNEEKKERLKRIKDNYKQRKLQLLKKGYVNNVSIYDR